jgi:hypothetical protein
MSQTHHPDRAGLSSPIHIGRIWSNGEPLLAMDASLLAAWRSSEDQLVPIMSSGWDVTSGRIDGEDIGVVRFDATVNDSGWLELFKYANEQVVIVQAVGTPYRQVLDAALAFQSESDGNGSYVETRSGALVIWSSTLDGASDAASWLQVEEPGVPPEDWSESSTQHKGGLKIRVKSARYRLVARSMTELWEDASFARWKLAPAP